MDYQLTQTGEQVQNILDAAPTTEQNLQSEITRSTEKDQELENAIGNEVTRAEGAEGELQTAIGNEKTRAEGAEAELQTAIGNEVTRAEGVEGGLRTDVDAINAKIPAQASSENKLATEGFVNSSVTTATADFKGTYNSLEALQTAVQDANANDYAFVISTDASGNTVYNRYKYVTGTGWVFEYALNNSSFTAAQWAAINSAITAALVAKLMGLPTAASLTEQLNDIITSVANEKTRAEGAEGVLRTSIADNAIAINTEKTRAQGVEGTLTTGLNNEILNRQASDTGLQQDINAEATLRTNADNALQQLINAINTLIPSQASSSNQLADKAFVNSSIATNTADFKGTYNSLQELEQTVTTANANDYAFVISTDASGNTVYNRYKYVTGTGWVFEYALNNSSFTAAQWSAINSGITAALVTKLYGLPTVDALNAMFAEITGKIPSAASSTNKLVDYAQMVAALATKQNTLTFDNTPTPDSQNPVKSGGIYAAIQNLVVAIGELSVSKQDALTFDEYPAAGSDNPVKSKGIYAKLQEKQPNLVPGENLDTYPVAGSANPITSGAVKNALDLEVSERNAAIAVETSRAEAAEAAMETDIETLRQLYNALQQSAPQVIEPSDTWPVANPSRTVIYRVIDRVNTPPEYYSDYMWNGTSMVLMATYNNAVDTTPKKDSTNLVTSGGVFANIGAFDISEYNKSGSTLATYADLTAALAALPSGYQKGGMSVKFVQSSDNKYVQFRLMSYTFNTNVANWQGVDAEPIVGSKNLSESGGVGKTILSVKTGNMYEPISLAANNTENGNYITTSGNPPRVVRVPLSNTTCRSFNISEYIGKRIIVSTDTLPEYHLAIVLSDASDIVIDTFSSDLSNHIEKTITVPATTKWLHINTDNTGSYNVNYLKKYEIKGITESISENNKKLPTSEAVYAAIEQSKKVKIQNELTAQDNEQNKYGTISSNRFVRTDVHGCSVKSFNVSALVGKEVRIKSSIFDTTTYNIAYVFSNEQDGYVDMYQSNVADVDKTVIVPPNTKWLHVNYDAVLNSCNVYSLDDANIYELLSRINTIIGNNTPLEQVYNSSVSNLQGTFTLSSTITINDNCSLFGQGCIIYCNSGAKIVLGNGSILDGIKFVGNWSPERESGDGTTYTAFGYKPIKYIHTGESEERYMDDDDLDNGSAPCFGIGHNANDALVIIPIDKSYNTTISNCIFDGFDRVAIYANARRHKESLNPQLYGNYFYECWTGVLLEGEFFRIHDNCYTNCIFGVVYYGSNINQHGEIIKCCDVGIYCTVDSSGHSEITSCQIAHCGISCIYMRNIPATLGQQINGCHIVDGYIGGYDNSNILIVGCRLDVYFRLLKSTNGISKGNSIICSNIGNNYLYGHELYDVPEDTQITLNRGMSSCTDAEANNQA